MSNEVIWYDSSETGAPTLNNVAGSMIAVLDACLINGFNVKSVTSIVVAGEVATVNCTGHGYSGAYGKMVKISGATPVELNGRKRITPAGVNSFTFPAPGVSDQTATGTISARRAPLETWEKPYAGTNKAMYRSTDTGSSGALLRLEDVTSAPGTVYSARAVMVESATGIDTYTNPCPTVAQLSGGYYWYRGANTAAAKTWKVIGDGRFFWLLVNGTSDSAGSFGFGDFKSYKAADLSNAMLTGAYNDDGGNGGPFWCRAFMASTAFTAAPNYTEGVTLLRSANGVTTSALSCTIASVSGMPNGSLGSSGLPAYPSIVDGGLVIAYPNLILETGPALRGEWPALAYAAAVITSIGNGALITGLSNSARTFLVSYQTVNNTISSPILFDITGPWR